MLLFRCAGIFTLCVLGGGGVQGAKIFINDQSRSLGAPLAKCLEILCAAMPYSAAWHIEAVNNIRLLKPIKNNEIYSVWG